MRGLGSIFRREFGGYFATPVAYVFICIFLFSAGLFTFFVGQFFQRGQADLWAFFSFLPWLYLFLMPALSMRLWAEERRSGTLELLLTLPVGLGAVVVGKFLAAWAFTAVALACTFPMWLAVSYLGQPDHGVIVAGYVGSLLMAGGYLAIGSCLSAVTKNQVVAFVLAVAVSFLFTVSGTAIVLSFFAGWAPQVLVDAIASFSFLRHFNSIIEGVIDLRDLVFFGSLIAAWLYATTAIVDMRKAG
jgi:ABC-2 type transport system permease protein